ncbi:MAG: four helix bundle protein [Verrucomicrobiota bacterium]
MTKRKPVNEPWVLEGDDGSAILLRAAGGAWSRAVLKEDSGDRPRVYDLEERTARFGEAIILFAKKIPKSPVNNRLIDQIVGAGTSIGANYCEADDGLTRRDFAHRIGISRKEARETKFFLRMIATAEPNLKAEARVLWNEARELHLIFCAIWRRGKYNAD